MTNDNITAVASLFEIAETSRITAAAAAKITNLNTPIIIKEVLIKYGAFIGEEIFS